MKSLISKERDQSVTRIKRRPPAVLQRLLLKSNRIGLTKLAVKTPYLSF